MLLPALRLPFRPAVLCGSVLIAECSVSSVRVVVYHSKMVLIRIWNLIACNPLSFAMHKGKQDYVGNAREKKVEASIWANKLEFFFKTCASFILGAFWILSFGGIEIYLINEAIMTWNLIFHHFSKFKYKHILNS